MQLYKDKKAIPWLKSFFLFLRDLIVFVFPINRFPPLIIKIFYGVNPGFVFFVHARRREDIYIARPFLVPLRRILGRSSFLRFLHWLPPFVLDHVKVRQEGLSVDGLVVTSIYPPETLLAKNKRALSESARGLYFISKICSAGTVVGLGGLWPMVTRRGMALARYAQSAKLILTNGHCGTLVSLFLTIDKLARISSIPLKDMKVAILGAGKMGANLARALYGKVAAITLVDINEKRLDLVERNLRMSAGATNVERFNNKEDVGGVSRVLADNHVVVSTTSNLMRILRPEQILPNVIIIDDSRPEGVPRDVGKNGAIVLEGGLLKIAGLKQHYDFGMGVDDNVFGCLAESFMLSADGRHRLSSTLGDVNFNNFRAMLSVKEDLGVSVGDFKCCDEIIPDEKLKEILNKKENLKATIPYRNICWVLRVEDLQISANT